MHTFIKNSYVFSLFNMLKYLRAWERTLVKPNKVTELCFNGKYSKVFIASFNVAYIAQHTLFCNSLKVHVYFLM